MSAAPTGRRNGISSGAAMADKPSWKGALVDRDALKDLLDDAFMKMADDYDAALAEVVDELELYISAKVLRYGRETVEQVFNALRESLESVKEMEAAIRREQLRRRAGRARGDEEDEE